MTGVDWQTVREIAQGHMTAGIYAHCAGTSSCAKDLALVYGVDPEPVMLAGLLHDWSRAVDDTTLLARAKECGIPVDAVDLMAPHLLHAQVGVVELRATFPWIGEDVLRSIQAHTLGSPEMTDADMIVYVADMIEPGRRCQRAQRLRESVGRGTLFELYSSAYAATFFELIERKQHLHPVTVDSWNSIVDRISAESYAHEQ